MCELRPSRFIFPGRHASSTNWMNSQRFNGESACDPLVSGVLHERGHHDSKGDGKTFDSSKPPILILDLPPTPPAEKPAALEPFAVTTPPRTPIVRCPRRVIRPNQASRSRQVIRWRTWVSARDPNYRSVVPRTGARMRALEMFHCRRPRIYSRWRRIVPMTPITQKSVRFKPKMLRRSLLVPDV